MGGLIFVEYQFRCFRGGCDPQISSTHEIAIVCMNYEEKYYGH